VFFSGHSGLEIVTRGLGLKTGATSLIDFEALSGTGIYKMQSFSNIGKLMIEEPFSMIMILFIILLIIVLLLFVVWLSNVSQIAIVNNTAYISEDKETNFQEGVTVGIKNFWPVFALNIFKKIVIVVILAIMSLPLLMSEGALNLIPANIIFSILFVVLVPAIISLAFVVNFTVSYVVIKKEKLNLAIKKAMKLFAKNWLISIEMGFLIYLISLLATFAAILSLLLLVTPFLLLIYLAVNIQSVALFGVVLSLSFVVFTLVIVFVGAVLSSFQNSANTLFFMKLIGGGGTSKIVRVFDRNYR